MRHYAVDPLVDPRWKKLLECHPRASVFHAPEWLEALRRTYGYEPVVYTTSPPTSELMNGVAFCRIESWLTGRRLVSLPFTDHCEPLADNSEDVQEILAFLSSVAEKENWKYIELRPESSGSLCGPRFVSSATFVLHKLDLRSSVNELLHGFHKDCVQRKIRRAEREALAYEEGRSESMLGQFYRLLVLTRRRHQLPPQPLAWFRNLITCLGDQVKIRVVSKDGQPIASILTLCYKNALVYKYGCSDARFHNLGGMTLLFWKAIQEAKQDGLQEFDLGRSDCDNAGLIAFKDHWGTTRSVLTYLRYPARHARSASECYRIQLAKRVFARVPDGILAAAGQLLYKHIG